MGIFGILGGIELLNGLRALGSCIVVMNTMQISIRETIFLTKRITAMLIIRNKLSEGLTIFCHLIIQFVY